MNLTRISIFTLTALFSIITSQQAAVTVGKDTIAPGDLTIVLKDFNGTSSSHSSLSNNAGQPNPTHTVTENGYSTYNVTGRITEVAASHDPKINFATTPFSVLEYTHVRSSLSYSPDPGNSPAPAPSSEMWPQNAVGLTQVYLGSLGTSFQEKSFAWTNPTNPSITTATTGGFRWDPVMPNILPAESLNFHLDYFMVDRGRVVGTEFDTVGTSSMGWSAGQINTGTLATLLDNDNNSVLRGVTSGGDPTLLRSGLTLDTSIYKYVEVRLKMEQNTQLQFFWATNQAGNTGLSESKSVKIFTGDNQWHTYLLDFTNEATWTGNLAQFRVDLGSNAGVGFNLDYIRFREIGVIPEPTKTSFICIALMSCLLRRRRA